MGEGIKACLDCTVFIMLAILKLLCVGKKMEAVGLFAWKQRVVYEIVRELNS